MAKPVHGILGTAYGRTGGYDADADDLVYIFLYCPDLNASLLATPVTRSTMTATVSVPNTWNGQRVYVWGSPSAMPPSTRAKSRFTIITLCQWFEKNPYLCSQE